jgi:uncharacterized membrane protein
MPARPALAASLFLTALNLGLGFSHILQAGPKLEWPGTLWRTTMETLYRNYAVVGGVVEIGSILAAWMVAFLLRRQWPAQGWAMGAALLLTLGFLGVWVGFITPLNAIFATWTPATVPADWQRPAMAWEVWHAVKFGVTTLAFLALTLAALADRPR